MKQKRDCLLEARDYCYKWKDMEVLLGELKDKGRWFKVEMRHNQVKRCLVCSVLSDDSRKYFVTFSEGFDLPSWSTIALRIRDLGVLGSTSSSSSLS